MTSTPRTEAEVRSREWFRYARERLKSATLGGPLVEGMKPLVERDVAEDIIRELEAATPPALDRPWPAGETPRYRWTDEGMTLDPKGAYVLAHMVPPALDRDLPDDWWTEPGDAMIGVGLPGDEGFVADAATPDDAARIVEAHNTALRAPSPALDRETLLDEAWKAAEAALPEGWAMNLVHGVNPETGDVSFGGVAWVVRGEPTEPIYVNGPTPAAALQALAHKLTENQEDPR